MAAVTVFAGVCALLQGLAGLAGAIFILLCIDYPTYLVSVPVTEFYSTTGDDQGNVTGPVIKVELEPIRIMADGYSKDPSRDLIFCFTITCIVFNLIWVQSSVFLLIGNQRKTARLLWQWVLTTLAAVFTDFVGAVYFAAKLGDHVTSFDDSQKDNLVWTTFTFLKYIYPLILFLVFGRGFVTIPINLLLAVCVNRQARSYHIKASKRQGISESVLKHCSPIYPVIPAKNGAIVDTNGPSPSAVYSNQCFTLDEKL